MTTLDLAQQRVHLRKVGSEWHGACPACGPGKSGPEKTDRFSVKSDGRFFCRVCTPSGGDAVEFLKKFEGKSCPEAHAALGRECESTTCPVLDRCSKGQGQEKRRDDTQRRTAQERKAVGAEFVPAAVVPPEERWLRSAEKLIERAHAELLESPDQLAYLAGRGLPKEAVVKYRLGWIPKDLFRPRSSWGLPIETWPDGKAKMLKIPAGILIPTFVDGQAHRLRIRRPKETLKDGEPGYLEVKGSGNDRIITNLEAPAIVVVESDLDALLIDWAAGDMVGAMPTVSASAKPKESTWEVLRRALCILVALDHEPTWDEEKQRWINVGGKASGWWKKQFPQARRWPTPSGKDPGEYFQAGGDLRAWLVSGLPPGLRVKLSRKPAPAAATAAAPTSSQDEPASSRESSHPPHATAIPGLTGAYMRGVSQCGRAYLVAEHREDLPALRQEFPEEIPFDHREITLLKGGQSEGAVALMFKSVFPESTILGVRPIVGDGSRKVATFDPSRQRAAKREQLG